MQVLAGDIGGTKALLAICEVDPEKRTVAVLRSERYLSGKFLGLGAICKQFQTDARISFPPFAGFGVAGPVNDGRSHTTNLPWVIDERDLAKTMGIRGVKLVNDFHATALGIQSVATKDLVTLNEGVHDPRGTWALLGAGTGLGEAIATLNARGERVVIATEGGHASFAPRTELEMGILRFLAQRHGHVSWERVLSGEGLVNLAEAIAHAAGLPLSQALQECIQYDRVNAPASVTNGAAEGDLLCKSALETFCKLYGAEAGNFALKTLATGGVYIAGGIAPRIVDHLKDGRFREAFFDKGRMRPLLESIPVQIVLDTGAGLLGAALLAARQAKEPDQ
jgi:glucokinase